MSEIPIKIYGICGSPVKGGNTETYLREALKGANGLENVETEWTTTAGKKISDCIHCNWCMTKSTPGKWCAIDDDMGTIYEKLIEADGILFATPVYIGRMSGHLANVIDRMRAFVFGNHRGMLKNKVIGSLSVGWFRHMGIETANLSIMNGMLLFECIPASVHHSDCAFGAGGSSSLQGTGKFIPEDKVQILKDEWGLKSARDLAKRMVELARISKLGRLAQFERRNAIHILKQSQQTEAWEKKMLKNLSQQEKERMAKA